MTDHNSPAGAVGGGQPSGQPGSFGPSQQPPQQAWQGQGQQAPAPQPAAPQASQPQPQQLPSDAARAQVAAAWVRNTPRAGQAVVPSLPPRETRPQGESKKEKRERERAARKAAYEQKKAEKEQRKRGGTATAAAPAPVAPTAAAQHIAPTATASAPQAPVAGAPTLSLRPTAGAPAHTATSAGVTAPAHTAPKPSPDRDFVVPKPGGRIPTGGRRTHVALRATLLITTCVFALGSCGVMGLVVGKSSGATTAGLDEADATRYRLTEFPTEQAAAFAEQYAQLCMTFSPDTSSTRRTDLARYASAGVDPECGWSGEGTSKAVSATWDGTAERLPEFGDHGRYIGVQVRTDDGTLTTLTVPVYVQNLKTGEGMRVAGDVGQMPLPARADVPELDQRDEVVDDTLSTQLQQKVLPGYFEAWGASDATAMSRFITPDATLTATTGLAGRMTKPQVGTVVALVPARVQGTDPYAYSAGQAVQVRVVVDWSDAKGVAVSRAYRMTIVNTAQGWFVKDIRGGVLDEQGGRADSDETDSDAATGSASPSAPASPSASRSTTPQAPKSKQPGKP
ncbi:conjugal transfer protein [Streptomyces sp. 3214.6]|uniref:conjugal transfer protein n=1 Tax=Streptomyces sp. 3214.6 TaxID=1882757 RepID=UPI000909D1FD|nr:conjugal transfer protein [Streptomyces sp. 3214.6]SHI12600.1 Conjugative transposon protein TcpC [Streptomyces sp. 3214.6]